MKLFCKLHLCPAFLFPKVSDIFACFFFIHTHPRPFAGLLLPPDILMPSFYMNFDIFALYSWFSTYKNAGIKVFPLFLHCLLFDYLSKPRPFPICASYFSDCNFNLVIFECNNTTFIITISSLSWTADNFITIRP